MRIKAKTKRSVMAVAGLLVLALLTGLVMNLYGVFDKKKVNPDNVISIENIEKNYAAAKTYNNGHGVKYTVEKDGSVKAKGTASGEDVFTVASGIKLEGGKTYTLSAGIKNAGYDTYYLRLRNTNAASGSADELIIADLDGTFTAPNSTDAYDVEIVVKKSVKISTTFRPVLVAGKSEGSFYSK